MFLSVFKDCFEQEEWQNHMLKVDINHCKKCRKELKKGLLKLNGIKSVHVYAKLNIVSIKTQVDSEYIAKKINEWEEAAELLHGKTETKLHSYRVELNDDDDEEEKQITPSPPLVQHKTSSSSSSCPIHSKTKGKSQLFQEWPEHICRDKYCTVHKRDIYTNYGGSYSPPYRGNYGGMNFFPRMRNPYVQPPPPPPGYYGQGMMPPYGGYQMPMNMPMANGFAGYSGGQDSNGCSIM